MRKWFILSALVVLAIAVSLPVSATVPLTSTGPFTGDYSEKWELFDNYYIDPFYRIDPTTIMNGTANISNGVLTVYQTGLESGLGGFGLGYYGLAPVSDGTKGMGLDASNQLATINSTKSWGSFGAYWGASKLNSFSDPNPSITVYAYDALNNLVGTDSFTYAGGGALAWHGWSFNKAVTKIAYTGDYIVIDGLQADEYKQTSAVPEPASLLGFGLPMLMVGLGKLKSLRK